VYFVQLDVVNRTNTVRRLDLNDIHATPAIVDVERSRQLSLAITMFESLDLLVISHTSEISASYSVVDTTMPSASAERIRLPTKTLNANFAEDVSRHQLIALATKPDGTNHIFRATRTPTGLDPWQHFATLAYPATSIQPTRRSYFVVERRDGVAAARQIDATTGAQIPIITVAVGQLALAAPEYAAPSINDDDPTLIELQTSTASQPMTYHGLTNGALISTHTQVRDHRWRNYREWTVLAPTPDNESVPIHLARHRDADPNAPRPTLLVCYGGFGAANDPYFEDSHKVLLDDGWNIGFVVTRGGGDFGLKWQQSGSGTNATVGAADLIAATQYLIDQRIADLDRVVAVGASYGGFVIGHAINLHPRLFRSVVVEAPWVDPLGDWQHDRNNSVHTLITAFGDVARSPHALRQLSLINPATNVAPGHFPAVYATIGRNDSRVSPIGVATWTEQLRNKTTSKAPVILEVLDGGHCAARQPNGLLRPQIGARAVAFIEHTTAPIVTQARQTRPSTASFGHELGIVLN
jgi:oligopeptidase B